MIARFCTLIFFCCPFSALAGEVKLLMFEEAGCVWCVKWNDEISAIYPKTQEGRTAPLHRLDIRDEISDTIALKSKPFYTPTFIVIDDGAEVGRIEGYPGEDFFWGLLNRILKPLPEFQSAKGASS